MKCPKCSGSLQHELVNGVPLDRCDNCSGLWFDEGEMEWLVKIYKLAIEDEFKKDHSVYDQKKGNCPRCKESGQMVRLARHIEYFYVDHCPSCNGHWLEAGELSSLRDDYKYKELLRKVHGQ